MAMPRKYLSKNDRYNYLLDHWSFTFYFLLRKNDHEPSPGITFNQHGKYYGWLKGRNQKIYIKRGKQYYVVCCYLDFNFNRRLREYYREYLGIKRETGSVESLDKKEKNVIPYWMLKKLQDQGITIPKIRRQGFRLIFQEWDALASAMQTHLRQNAHLKVDTAFIRASVTQSEVDYDIVTSPGVQLARSKIIKKQFKIYGEKWNNFQAGKGGTTLPDSEMPHHNTSNGGGVKDAEHITTFLGGKRLKLYLKDCSKAASINRAEIFYNGKESIKKDWGSAALKNKRDLVRLAQKIAMFHFPIFYELINKKPALSSRSKLARLKRECYLNCGRHWYEIFKKVKRDGAICTSTTEGLYSSAIATVVLKLVREGKLFRKKSKAVYEVDWNWVLHHK